MKNVGILKIFMALVIACLFMTCDPGLGKAVDTQAPKVEVKYPATKSVLKGGFTMTGVASDEVNVASCEVTFSLIKNPEIKYHFNATVADDEFSVAINNPKADGSFEIPDGDYNVTVTVSDAYRNSTTDVVYTIDNTAPTVLLTSPNSYSESNWPNMYKTFNIKGEVYDATTIQTVTVYLVDENGTILKEVIADGTNTFLANFEEPFPEEKLCFYYAVAKDAGGNVNTYCYHKSDIFKLLSETNSLDKTESATKSITFPSINSIGYVDQGQSSNVTELIDEAKLTAIRINNNAPKKEEQIVGDVKKEVIVFPGFNYFAKDTAQVRWLNISKESLSGIAIGSPVLATIMPPTDGSAIDYSSVKVKISKSIDGTIENFEDFANIKAYDACVISEGEVGDKRVKLTAVGESLNVQTDSHPPEDEHDNWLAGFYKIEISFSTDSGNMASDSCRFEVSSGAPKLTEGVFAEGKENASYYRGYITSKTAKKALGGKSLSSDGNLAVELKWDVVGLTLDGKDKKDSGYAELSENGNYEIPIEVDVENHTTDGEYTYTLTAAPNSTLSTVISRVVVIDTLNPVVEFSNLANGDILENDEFIVKGNIDDANGISKVEYQLIENGGSAEWKEISNAKSSFNLQLSSLKENVTYTLKIRATDVAGNISGDDDYKCNFTIDLANPIATIDNPQPETGSSIYFTNEIPVFEGKASDDSKTAGKLAKTAILSYSKDGVAKGNITAGTSEGQFNWNQAEGTWTWNATESQFDGTGKYDVKLVVTDDSGKTTEDTLTVSLDVTPPSIKLTQVSPYVEREDVSNGDAKYYVNGDITVKFDITENDYIKSIDWYKIDGTKDSQDLGTNAQPTVKVKTTDFADGKKLSEFKLVVTDRSGNTATYTGNETELVNYEINQDSDNPTIDIAGINPEITTEAGISANNNLFSTSDSISITLKDDDGVASGTYQIDGNSEKTINGGNAKVKTETISLNGLNQGPHTIELSVRDTNGKEVSTETIYFGIDDKAPDLTIDGYSGTDIDAGFKNADFDITGTASDSYEFKQLICYVDLNTTKEITRNGTNWTKKIEKPNSSEKKTIRFVASDKFSRTTIKTFTYIFDLDKPNLIINDVQKDNITDKYFNQNSILTLSGTANDLVGDTATQSGLKFVQYAIGTGHNATLANSDGWQNANGSTDWTVLLNIPKYQDGQYTLLVKALDNSDNESEVQKFNITADSVSPILTEGESSDASGTSYASGTLNLTGTVTEKNLNSLIYTYSLDGQEKESDDVQIPPNNGDEVSWSITKDNLEDGTHVFKIIATDKAGNSSVITRNIIIDETAPEITTNVSPQILYNNGNGEEPTVNGTINVNVRVAETNKIKGVYYTFDNWASQESFNETEFATGKTILVDTTKYENKSKLPLKIKAVDEAGNEAIEEINPIVNQESDKPSLTPSNLDDLANESAAGWTEGNPNNVFNSSNSNMIFTLSDDDSVKEYWVKIDNNEFVKVADVNSAQQIVTYSVKDLSYDRHTITFRVKDSNCKDDLSTTNNFVEKTYYFAIDDEAPNLTVKNANNQYVGDSFTISGTVTDANGIDKIEISSNENTEKIDYDGTKQTEEFSYTFNVPQIVDPEEKDIITITAYDSIGNRKEVQLTYLVDKTSPELSIQGGTSAYVDADYPSLRIAGTATDGDLGGNDNGISGIDQVRLKIGSSITSVDDAESVLAVGKIENGVMSWSSSVDFTDKDAGSYSIYIQAFDHAGNVSAEETLTVYVDDDVPQLSHDYTDNFVGVYNKDKDIVIEGTASDASGVKSVTAKIQGATGNLSVTFNETTNNSDSAWSFTVPKSSGDGQLTILVTATDGCGKSVQETFTATLDTEAPSVTFTDISDDNDDNNTTIETSKTTDKPRVSVTYADSTSGVNSVEYTFYYYDPNGNISGLTPDADGFIDYSDVNGNASGSFTRDKSFSGTVVMRMAESTGSTGAFINTETNTDGIWYVKVTITDEAGNSAEYDSPYFYVDQHKPVLNVTSPASSVNLKKQNDALEVTGTTSDSYGGDIDKVVVKIYHPSYNGSQQANFTKTFTKDGSNGTETLTKNGESYQFTYTWNGANSPFVYPDVYELLVSTYDVAGNETVRTPQKISCDNTAPTITFSRPYSYSVDAFGNVNEGIVVNSPIGDTSIKVLADDYSMASIYYQIGGTVDIEATGSIGSSNYKITKLTVENGGVGTDTYGTSVNDVKLDGVNIALAGNWNKLTSANLDFDVEYNTLNMVNAGKTYHADGDKETIQTLDVHFVAVDTAGNINYCKYPLKVDTDTDKPTLLMLSPKTINDVANVGGTATISGTVNDDNAVHSVWMQVELVNGNYNENVLSGFTALTYGITEPQVLVENIVDGKPTYSSKTTISYFADRTKWYKVNLGAENSTSTTWNMMLNKKGEFDIANLKESGSLPKNDALKQTELLIKVKALDTKANDGLSISSDAKAGDSTEFRLIIDSGSPSIIINNIADFPAEGSYIGGNITFDLEFSDDQSITEWKLEAISTASGDNSSMLIASDEYSGSYEDGLGKTVTPVADGKYVGSNGIITVDTADIYAQCGNLIQFKISAKDNSKDPNSETESPKESYLTFKYTIDNSAPDASYVSTIDGYSYYIDTESIEGDSTGAHRESVERDRHLRIISDQAAFTGKVFDEANGSGIDYVMLYFTKGNRLYNPSEVDSSFEISNHLSVKDKDGNSVSPLSPVGSLKDVVRTSGTSNPYIIVDRAEGMLDSGANGDLDGYDENLKANGDWVVYIKSSNLPDGVYDIHYVVVDFAGNARYYSDTMLVQNYAPTINSIVLATDIDGDGEASIGNDDKGDEYQKFVTREFTSTGFNVRNNKLKIQVNVTGGTGNLKYYLRYKTKNGEVTTNSSNPGYSTGEFEVTDFLGDSGIPVDYVVWVEDSVEQNLSLSSGETTIDMIMDNEDDVAPVAQFFELNTIIEDSSVSNSNRGSLYKDGSVKGHIETRQNSPVDNDSEQDPDVSGTIILRGEVLDNQRIESIVLRLNDTNVTIAKWNPNLSLLELKDANAKIYDSLGLLGHYVEWQYAWDTNSFAKYDTDVKVIVTDSAGKVSGNKDYSSDNTPRTESNKFTLDNWGYNSMTVDVVPYITGLGTTLSRIEKRNPSVYGRSTLGKYPVYYYRKTVSEGKESEEITVEGFNILSGSTVTFEGGATTSLDVNKVFTLPENAKSGKIFVTVSEVPSLNNANDNGAVGSSGEYYNQKPNGQNNDLLTDDIEVLIWEINSKAAMSKTGELSEVMMHVNPANGMVGFAFAHSQDLASYPKGNDSSYQTWMTDWTGVNQIGFVYDQKGNMYGTNGGTDTYTPSKKTGRLGLISSHWGIIADDSKNGDWYTGYTKYHRLRLEYLGMTRNGTYASNVYRFAKGDSTQLATTYSDAKGTNLYMLYYDNTLGELKFKAGNFGTAPTDPCSSISGDVFGKSEVVIGDFADDANNATDNQSGTNYLPNYKTISIVANQNGAKGNSNAKPGIYYSVDAISSSGGQSDVVVAVWYDDVNKTLWYSYLKNPLTNAGNRTGEDLEDPIIDSNGVSTEWSQPIAILDGHAGGYCAIKADDAGGIHIAAYSRNDAGSLYYAYLNSYDADYNENENLVAVDAYGSTGQYITMEVAKDSKGKYIPYIGYYMSSMSYPKYAYLVDTDSTKAGATYYPKPGVDENNMFTGAWETILLPTTSTIVIDDINVGVYKNADGTLQSIPKQTETVGTKSGIAGGNGTSNPIFAYGISQTGSGYIETAQLK
ncbi:MAG: hypothetical protein E7064_00880 [Spirochaetaceae bacterium]|nr:hypothetical protein [Spirochaetaceae bacterium]